MNIIGLEDFWFTIYTFVVFYGVLFIPVLFVCLKISYYPLSIPYLLLNWLVLLFNFPLVLFYALSDYSVEFSSINNVSFFVVAKIFYNLPLVFVLAFYVFKYKYRYKLYDSIEKFSKFYNNKKFVKILAYMFLLANIIEFLLYYIIYYI